jgi:hypothetical protein
VKKPVDFDWYCKAKKDVINNAAYELIVALTAKSAPPRKFELSIPQRDDEMIANVVEGAINGRSSDRLLLPSILSGSRQAPVLPW